MYKLAQLFIGKDVSKDSIVTLGQKMRLAYENEFSRPEYAVLD
jgi:hypothetical protein